jgi:large exoprotein involved in heme utilization and adhesion
VVVEPSCRRGSTGTFGNLSAKGGLAVINPAGIFIGSGAQFEVHSLILSSLDVDHNNFLNRSLNFHGADNNTNSVINHGQCTIEARGLAALVGPSVSDTGSIVASFGAVVLGSVHQPTIDSYGDGLVHFGASAHDLAAAGVPVSALTINNAGTIDAAGGRVVLAVGAVKNVLDGVFNTSGVIRANGSVKEMAKLSFFRRLHSKLQRYD